MDLLLRLCINLMQPHTNMHWVISVCLSRPHSAKRFYFRRSEMFFDIIWTSNPLSLSDWAECFAWSVSMQVSYSLKWTAYARCWAHILYRNRWGVPLMSCRLRLLMLKISLARILGVLQQMCPLSLLVFFKTVRSYLLGRINRMRTGLNLSGTSLRWLFPYCWNELPLLSLVKNHRRLTLPCSVMTDMTYIEPHIKFKRWLLHCLIIERHIFSMKVEKVKGGDKLLDIITQYSTKVCSPTFI